MACCNKHCCGSINRCCRCVSPFDRCGNLIQNTIDTSPTFVPVSRSTLTNLINYAFFVNDGVTLTGDTIIPLTTNVLNGTEISISNNEVNLVAGNYEVNYSVNITSNVEDDVNAVYLSLNGTEVPYTRSQATNNNLNIIHLSGVAIIKVSGLSTLTINYLGEEATLNNVRLTVKKLA